MAKAKKGALVQFLVPMVDSTDFASIESGITESDFNSGVTKKFYGVNYGGSAATTSGTISKTGSLVRSGVFRITLKTTENNYDQMMIRLNKTGCAEQILTWENVDNDDSDIMSALVVVQSMASDAASAAQQGNSRALLLQSAVSDISSNALVRLSMLSDIASMMLVTQSMASDAASAAVQANSRVLLNQSRISDLQSFASDFMSDFQSRVPKAVATNSQLSDLQSDLRSLIVAGVALSASDISDLRSAIAAGPAATITASDISNIASAVWREKQVNNASASSFGSIFGTMVTTNNQVNSRVLLSQSRISDINSLLAAGVPLDASTISDIRSAVAAVTATVSASDISDIASAVWANTTGAATSSRVLVMKSTLSDAYSMLSDLQSDFQSRVPKAVATNSQLSDLASDIRSVLVLNQSAISDLYSQVSDFRSDLNSLLTGTGVQLNASTLSDLRSAITAGPAGVLTASDISDIASAVWGNTTGTAVSSRVLVAKSSLSDIQSYLSDMHSNLLSFISGAGPTVSDLASAFAVEIASNLSDILSAAQQTNSRVLINQSRISDLQSFASDFRSDLASFLTTTGVGLNASAISDVVSAVRVNLASDLSDILSAATQTNSRALVVQSMISDVASNLSDFKSDFGSRVPKLVATSSQLSDLASDVKSAIGAVSVVLSASNISDLASAVVAGIGFDTSDIASAVNVELGSRLSDILSAAQQVNSRALVLQSGVSDITSTLAAGVPLDASTISDIRSAIATIAITASDMSDIASRVDVVLASRLSDILSAAQQVNSRVLVNQSTMSDVTSFLSDFQSDFNSRVPKLVATNSQVLLTQSMASDAASAAQQANSRILLVQSAASDIYSALGVVGVGVSGISDIASAVWATAGSEPTTVVSATATMKQTLDWLRALSRNKITQTATVQSLRNDADNADIASAAVSDDATTAIRGEWGN